MPEHENTRFLMLACLSVSVPVLMRQLAKMSDWERERVRAEWSDAAGDPIAFGGDQLLYRTKARPAGKNRGEDIGTAATFNLLAKAIAAAAYAPGGITFCGAHWCVNHDDACRETQDQFTRLTDAREPLWTQ